MNTEIQEMTANRGRIVFSETDASIVNAIRRTMIADVPKMAIESVEYHMGAIMDDQGKEYESVSPLFDEMIAHRLGMLPIPTDLDVLVPREKCSCEGEGCPNCTIMYSINKKGPCTVYSGDLEPLGDAKLRIKDDLVPIVKLKDGQAILAYATAQLSTGREHAKYSPVCGIGYRYSANIRIDSARCDLDEACIEVCPKDVFVREGKKIVIKHPERCNLCMACVERCELDCITVEEDRSRIILKYETDGAIGAKDLVIRSLKILEEKFDGFREMISSLEG
ncbi:MAG TPA: DNA-directed RNA polymerase subunit D [Euryarchaeota archaeon]|nr:DNA-directed RNA polymerase subunit D [Euryarchaeota archaeon]